MQESPGKNKQRWVDFIKSFEERGGENVRKIDDAIKPAVFGFNTLGIPTHGSCEGHLDHGQGFPYITFGHPPQVRFNREKETFQRIADKYGLPVEDVEKGLHHQATGEAFRESEKNGETPEYIAWREEPKKLLAKLEAILEEFYRTHSAPPDLRLIIELEDAGTLRLRSRGTESGIKPDSPNPSDLTEDQKKERLSRLRQYRSEIDTLAAFLKNKFLDIP